MPDQSGAIVQCNFAKNDDFLKSSKLGKPIFASDFR